MTPCRKRKHRSPAAARKWLRHKYKGGADAKHIYPCPHHGDELVYHLTRMKQPETPMTATEVLKRRAEYAAAHKIRNHPLDALTERVFALLKERGCLK